MGWKWSSDPLDGSRENWSSPFRHPRIGFGEIAELENPNPTRSDRGDCCSTRRIVSSQCNTEEIEPGKFVRRCEKTEQLLRDCVGRPAEVVESKTEYTEDDVTDEMTKGSLSSQSPVFQPFSFPGLRNDIEALERSVLGSFSSFFEAAEEMRNGFFQAFGMPPVHDMEPSPFSRQNSPFDQQKPAEGMFEKDDDCKLRNESPYNDFSGQVRDV